MSSVQLTLIFFKGVGIPPTRISLNYRIRPTLKVLRTVKLCWPHGLSRRGIWTIGMPHGEVSLWLNHWVEADSGADVCVYRIHIYIYTIIYIYIFTLDVYLYVYVLCIYIFMYIYIYTNLCTYMQVYNYQYSILSNTRNKNLGLPTRLSHCYPWPHHDSLGTWGMARSCFAPPPNPRRWFSSKAAGAAAAVVTCSSPGSHPNCGEKTLTLW